VCSHGDREKEREATQRCGNGLCTDADCPSELSISVRTVAINQPETQQRDEGSGSSLDDGQRNSASHSSYCIDLLKPTGHVMHHQLAFNNYVLCPPVY
jgi:hypothetical protein